MDLVQNIKRMYAGGDGHVCVLAASLRHLEHLLYTFALDAELATAPAKLLQEWAAGGMPQPDKSFQYRAADADGKPLQDIPYQDLNLGANWDSFDIRHELTDVGIRKFVSDYQSTLGQTAA